MARARTPVAKAAATGADVKNPSRHAGRKSPGGVDELGGPSMWLDLYAKRAFAAFKRELPWLKESHRVLVELASFYRGKLLDPESSIGLQAMQELRRCLAQLGATPADESRVSTGTDDGQEDPDEALFNGAGAGQPPPPPPRLKH